jgi:hypothetical protein
MSEVDDTLMSALQKDAPVGKKDSFGSRARSAVAAAEFSSGLDALDLDSGPELESSAPPAPAAAAAPTNGTKSGPRSETTSTPKMSEPQPQAAKTEEPAPSSTLATLQPVKQTGMTSWFARVWQKLRGWFAED